LSLSLFVPLSPTSVPDRSGGQTIE
jgi:hypothetical protein